MSSVGEVPAQARVDRARQMCMDGTAEAGRVPFPIVEVDLKRSFGLGHVELEFGPVAYGLALIAQRVHEAHAQVAVKRQSVSVPTVLTSQPTTSY